MFPFSQTVPMYKVSFVLVRNGRKDVPCPRTQLYSARRPVETAPGSHQRDGEDRFLLQLNGRRISLWDGAGIVAVACDTHHAKTVSVCVYCGVLVASVNGREGPEGGERVGSRVRLEATMEMKVGRLGRGARRVSVVEVVGG
jgi:hypothetical protein